MDDRSPGRQGLRVFLWVQTEEAGGEPMGGDDDRLVALAVGGARDGLAGHEARL